MQCRSIARIENPCVGGSIPPQATSVHAPQRPFRVLGRFYYLGLISTIRDLNLGSLGEIVPGRSLRGGFP